MSKVTERFTAMMNVQTNHIADTYLTVCGLVIAEQLERIADALEKQNASNATISIDGLASEFEKARHEAAIHARTALLNQSGDLT